MKKKKWVNSKVIFTITMVFVGCCFMSTSLWADYCESSGDPYYLCINRVVAPNLDNPSDCTAGYSDFTNLTANLIQGKEFSVSLESYGFLGFPKGWKIWIDYNGDNDFDDEGEEVFSAFRSYTVTGCILVPCCTIIGNTRMRVSMASNLNFTSCGPIGDGEVEDYTVNISSNPDFGNVGNTTVFGYVSTAANLRAMPFYMPENGEIRSITMYHQPAGEPEASDNMILAVYSAFGSDPQNIIAVTPPTAVSSTLGWQTICLTNPVWVAEGNTIWLAWLYENNPGIHYQPDSPGRAQSSKTWSDGMPDPFGPHTDVNYIYSIYATYRRCGCD
ncbi:MAG: hypothetical protein JSV88_10650 [Candidatus Aminicenantes bacterium]|nr:MAG: hypothetical protein JSV88_10650 [Candidatus Aminicenantes bacterium]